MVASNSLAIAPRPTSNSGASGGSLGASANIAHRAAERVWRSVRRKLRGAAAIFVSCPNLRPPVSPIADSSRFERIRAYLCSEGLLGPRDLLVPRAATLPHLALVHDRAYLAGLQDPGALQGVLPNLAPGGEAEAIAWQRFAVGGTAFAMKLATQQGPGAKPVVHLGGGLHHAFADRGEGFCIFNDVAVGIAKARARGWTGRVMVVDLDLHQGNGTRSIFRNDSSVFTLSVHARTLDDERAVANLDVELGSAVGDTAYLQCIREVVLPAVSAYDPALVVYVAGVDVAHDDALGDWLISPEAVAERDRLVMHSAAGRSLVWVLAGGYGPEAWRYSARSLYALLAGRDRPIPSDVERHLERFRRIRRRLGAEDLSRERSDEDDANFGIRESDIYGDLMPGRSDSRLLGFYTAYGIEVAMERYGVLDILRRQGYPRIEVQLDPGHATGQLVRVRSDDDERLLLVELVLREAREIAPWRLLAIEWLLMQNPRVLPSANRPLLPGQQHPGLGALEPLIGMLSMSCERLGFHGLLFNPAHYHMAALARAHLAFLKPQAEATFLAMRRALTGLSLVSASHAVAEGRVVDRRTGSVVKWHPAPMVLAVGPALEAEIRGENYLAAVRAALDSLEYSVAPPVERAQEEE